jgi:sugar phosphate isomerase/epimerase
LSEAGLRESKAAVTLAVIDRPNCKLGFDAWSPALRGEPLHEAAKKAAPHTVLTTNADYIRVPRHRHRPELVNYEPVPVDWVRAVPFGTGCIDYAAFFHGLRDGGALANLDACARTNLKWMKAQKLI